MKWFLWPFGLLVLGAFVLRVATPIDSHNHFISVGGAWWFVLGVSVGLVAGFATHLAAERPWHWRVQVKGDSYGKVDVKVVRLFSAVRIATLNPQNDDFDEKLHERVAEARAKAMALEVAGR